MECMKCNLFVPPIATDGGVESALTPELPFSFACTPTGNVI